MVGTSPKKPMTQAPVQSNVDAALETLLSSPDFSQMDLLRLIGRSIERLTELCGDAYSAKDNLSKEEIQQLYDNLHWLYEAYRPLGQVKRVGRFLLD